MECSYGAACTWLLSGMEACWLQVVFLAGIQLDVTRVPPPAKAATSRHALTRFGPEPRAAVERQSGHIRALRAGQGEQSSELGPGGDLIALGAQNCAKAGHSDHASRLHVELSPSMPWLVNQGGNLDLPPPSTHSAATV